MIKAIIFDVDGVLLDSFEANFNFFQSLMTYAGYHPPTREEYSAIFHLTMWDAIKKLTGLTSEANIKKIWEMGKNREVKYPLDLLTTPDSIEEVITSLSKKYFLGIVTSRVKGSIYEAPGLAKIKKYFQVTISCEDTVNHKPHPESLLLAVQKLKVKPEEAVYIGDVANDLKAARAADMKVIIYSKNELTEADACTSSFEKLPELIDAL